MIHSLPYRVNPEKACECCVFGTGQHEVWCADRVLTPQEVEKIAARILDSCCEYDFELGF
jgi:hypothetical protein